MHSLHMRTVAAAILLLPCCPCAPPRTWQADEGKLLLWGAVGTPVTGGMLIWRSGDAAEVERFVKRDPFVANGLVRHW